jgi:peptidoglycan/LPS O-acetylase OafA/YrhL
MVFASHVFPGEPTFYSQLHIPPSASRLIIALAASGAFGVDLFFALSSFLITTLLLKEHRLRGSIDISSFYLRRVLRIWPLYFVFLLIVAPIADQRLSGAAMPLKYIAAFALLSGNWACAHWGYPHSVAGPLWSVSIEEQFYLTWPLIMRRWIHHLARVALAFLFISFAVRVWLVIDGAQHPQIWCNTLARLDPIAGGVLLAVFAGRREISIPSPVRALMLLVSVGLLLCLGIYGDFVGTRALLTFPIVTLVCVTLILCTLNYRIPSRLAPAGRVLAYLGRISYGLYVFHLLFIFVFDVSSTHGAVARPGRAIAAFLATVVTAAISYHFFEKYFLWVKDRFSHVKSRPQDYKAV